MLLIIQKSDMMSQIIYPQVREIADWLRREKVKMSPFYVEGDTLRLWGFDLLWNSY